MFINGIKYIGSDQKAYAYKFGLSTGRYRNLICFHGSLESIHQFRAAIFYGLTGHEDDTITQTILYLSDDNGDHWIVDRSRQRLRILKNKNLVEAGAESMLKRALLEWDPAELPDDAALIEWIELQRYREQWVGQKRLLGSLDSGYDDFVKKIRQKLQNELQSLQAFLGLQAELDLNSLKSFCDLGWEPYCELEYLKQQLSSLNQDFRGHHLAHPEDIHRLENEVKLIRKLGATAGPLLDPGQSPLVLRERFQSVETALQELMTKLDLESIPKVESTADLERLIPILARYQVYEKLEQAYRKVVARADNSVRPVLGHYVDSMRSFLRQDRKILGELEGCLERVQQSARHLAEESEPQAPRHGLARLFERMREPPPQVSSAPAKPQRDELLQQSRQAVNTILQRLGELHSNFDMASQRFDEGLNEVDERHEKVVKELGAVKDTWLKSAKSMEVDPNISLKNLLQLIADYARLLRLEQERQQLRDQLFDYRSRLHDIEAQIGEWYRLTGSQKAAEFSQPSMLLREAKVILSYRDKKEKQLEKLSKNKLRAEAFHSMEAQLRDRLAQAQRGWRDALAIFDLADQDPRQKDWKQFFSTAFQVRSCIELVDRFQSGQPAWEYFANLSLETPLTVFQMPKRLGGEHGRNQLIGDLENASPHGHALLLVQDPLLADILQGMGIACAQQVAKSTNKPAEGADKQEGRQRPAVLSERARAALELFKARNVVES